MMFDFMALAVLLILASVWAARSFITSPPYIDPARYPVKGIDISSHNGMVNFEKVKEDNVSFVFIKASEGDTFRDDYFSTNYRNARKAGLKVGAYHFFRFEVSGVRQAMNLLKAVGNRELDLGLVIDVEAHSNPDTVPLERIVERLQTMVEYLNMKGHRVTFYSNNNGYFDYLAQDFKDTPLWVCNFSDPPINAPYDFWQYSHSGEVKGVNGKCDLNVFNGSREEWYDYLLQRQENDI